MTGVLATFMAGSDESNMRDELDGAAWRFALPGDAAEVTWALPSTPAYERDRQALARIASVVRDPRRIDAVSGRVELVVASGRSAAPAGPVGIDLSDDRSGTPIELRWVDDELRGLVPADDVAARAVLGRHVGEHGPLPRTVEQRIKQRIRRHPAKVVRTTRGSLRGVQPGPPAWAVEAAAAHGIEISDFGWALWCRGDFGSQKLVMFLLPPGGDEPAIVVKITRDARFNDRLANESVVLRALERMGPGVRAGAPAHRFDASVWGSAATAQDAVIGADLVGLLPHRPDLVDRVTTWMIELANAERAPIDADELGRCLDGLVDRYCSSYVVPSDVERFLRAQAGLVVARGVDAVVQHGDPGPWNAVVTPDDRVVFLDWEAGELRGMPLWDLLYFLRSAALRMSSRPPWRSRRAQSRRDLVVGSDLGREVAGHVHRYVAATGLDPTLVEPLFHLCWVQRAVKQARRLEPGRRSTGTFHRLVLDGFEGRDRPGLRLLTMRAEGAGDGRL